MLTSELCTGKRTNKKVKIMSECFKWQDKSIKINLTDYIPLGLELELDVDPEAITIAPNTRISCVTFPLFCNVDESIARVFTDLFDMNIHFHVLIQ
jgi:hypothetical protein